MATSIQQGNQSTRLAGGLTRFDRDVWRAFGSLWSGASEAPKEVAEARRLARQGNPFPLIALQWPSLLIFDRSIGKYFDGEFDNPLNPKLRLDTWQRQIIAACFDSTVGEIFVKGATGTGKGGCVGIAMNVLFDAFESQCRIHITSVDYKHAFTNAWNAEIRRWRGLMEYPCGARLLTESLSGGDRRYIKLLNPAPGSDGEEFSGIHSENTIYLFDEASGTEDIWYENALKNARLIVGLSNPRRNSGWFRDGFRGLEDENKTGYLMGKRLRRLCVTVGGMDCVNVKQGRLKLPTAPLDGIKIGPNFYAEGSPIPQPEFEKVRVLIPGQMDVSQYRMNMKEPDEQKRLCFAEGKFMTEDPDTQLILRSWMPFHTEKWPLLGRCVRVEAFGFDASRSSNGDDSVLTAGGTDGIFDQWHWKAPTYKGAAEEILRYARERCGIDLTRGSHPVCIDFGGGYGAGVAEWLTERGVAVMEFHHGSAKFNPKEYMDLRTESYALLARRLDPRDLWGEKPWLIPPKPRLLLELTSPEKHYPTGDITKFRLERKENLKERLKGAYAKLNDKVTSSSPDCGDSVVLLYWAVFHLNRYWEYISQFSGVSTSLDDDKEKETEIDTLRWIQNNYGGNFMDEEVIEKIEYKVEENYLDQLFGS